MVIQRWQTVFLLLAAILMGVYAFLPFAMFDGVGVSVLDYPFFLVLNVLVVLMLLIDIFLYKNLGFQIKMTMINSLLVLGTICCAAILTFNPAVTETVHTDISWTLALPIVAFVMTRLARRRMISDKRLLSAADRLR